MMRICSVSHFLGGTFLCQPGDPLLMRVNGPQNHHRRHYQINGLHNHHYRHHHHHIRLMVRIIIIFVMRLMVCITIIIIQIMVRIIIITIIIINRVTSIAFLNLCPMSWDKTLEHYLDLDFQQKSTIMNMESARTQNLSNPGCLLVIIIWQVLSVDQFVKIYVILLRIKKYTLGKLWLIYFHFLLLLICDHHMAGTQS